MTVPTPGRTGDPVSTLRQYAALAPWNVRDFVQLAGRLLEVTGVRPTSGAATLRPSIRTLRFYVTRSLLDPPDGKGAAATYSYRHLLRVLWIKLRQMEGATLDRLLTEAEGMTGDAVERRVAQALGPDIPPPGNLPLDSPRPVRGRAGRALHLHDQAADAAAVEEHVGRLTRWHRIPLGRGLELHMHEGHPLAESLAEHPELPEAVRRLLHRLAHESDT